MDAPAPRRSFDLRYFFLFLVLAGLFGAGTHFVHAYQVRRNARVLLDQANRAEAEGDLDKAADYLARFDALAPANADAPEARARCVLLRDRQAKDPAAKLEVFLRMEDVLRRDPAGDRGAVRRRAAELALELHRPADARAHLEVLMRDTPGDPALEDLLGRCEEESKRFEPARSAYKAALLHAPARVETAARLARLIRSPLNPAPKEEKDDEADKVMAAAVAAAPDSLEARMTRCRYLQAAGKPEEAEKDLAYVREKLAPDDAEVLLLSADVARSRRRTDEVRGYLERGHRLHPDDARFPLGLARLELAAGAPGRAAAAKWLREAVPASDHKPDLAWTLADLFLDAGEPGEARERVDHLVGAGVSGPALDYLNARLLAAEGKYGPAVDLLEQCRGVSARGGAAPLEFSSNLLLGTWYERLGNPEQQLAAYERALREDPLSVQARAGRAAALVALGKDAEALPLYRGLVGDAPVVRLNLARLLTARALRQPADQRDWEEPERLLRQAPPEVKARPEHRLLLIDLLAVSGRRDAALAEAEAACKEHPGEARYWLARAALAERGDKPDPARALAVLDEAAGHLRDSADLRLARAARLASRPAAEARPALAKLAEGADALPAADRGRLRAGLSVFHLRLGDADAAGKLLNAAARDLPDDLGVRQRLFDLAMLEGDDASAALQVAEVRRVEGEEGVLWRYQEALRRVQAARKGDAAGLTDARRYLTEASARRPGWGRLLALEGEIAELEGRTDLALEDYQKAIENGEQQPRVVRRAVQLLASRRRTDEARQLLQKAIGQSPGVAGDLNRLLVEISLSEAESKEQSLAMARAAVSPNSRDYRDFLWLGQVLASLGETKEAEAALRQAVRLRDSAPEVRIALIKLLADTGRKDEARAELEQAQRTLSEEARPAVVAAGREALGDVQAAESAYLAMLKARPDDPAVRHTVAAFYLRNGPADKADYHLRFLADGDGPDAAWARRTLAMALAMTGEYPKYREALQFLDKNLKSRWVVSEDERTRALVLALRAGDRRASIRALEDSFLRIKATPGEQFLLAQLYEADRNWSKANEILLSLANSKEGATPDVLAFYVRALLHHNENDLARGWLKKLQAMEPGGPRAVELEARVLKAEGKGDDLARLVTEYARKESVAKKTPQLLGRAGTLLDELGRPADAEQMFRLYADADKSSPEGTLALATYLAGHKRLPEALQLCERAATRYPPEAVALTAVGALRLGEAGEQDRDRVRTWLEAEIRKKPASAPLLIARADLLDAYGDYAGAEKVYRTLLEQNPSSVLVLNNLAWLLAVYGKNGQEALPLIEKAIALAGPGGDLLDTQASVYLTLGRPDEAVKKLESALQQMPTGSRYFHLAQAYDKAGQPASAKDAWQKATRELQLQEKALHPLERADFQRFNAEWAPPKG